MVSGENRPHSVPEIDNDLAKDVANLYSWANVEDASYRDFSSQRKTRHIRQSTDMDIRKIAGASAADASIEKEANIFQSAASVPAENPPLAASPVLEPPVETDLPRPTVLPVEPARSIFTEPSLARPSEGISTSVAIYSLAGGVGKTTLCANLGRIFCAMKEKVLLVDASGSGLLPFYFGATDLRSGLRTFVAPDANYPPLQVIGTDEITKQWLENDVKAAMGKVQRTIFDLGPASKSLLQEVFGMCGTVLIPLLPDLNSILTLSRIEAPFNAMHDSGMDAPEVFYLFNRFDQHDPMDQQARELVERKRGERLLPLTVRYGAEISKAIASRMTVADHAPGSAVTHDFLEVASWVRKRAPVRAGPETQMRWSER